MKLERFKVERDAPSIKTLLISFSIILLFILMFLVNKSHALYRVTESHDVIKARVGNFIYNINYDLDGGSLPDGVENPSSYSSVEETTITNPVKEGYTFKGWEGFSRNLLDYDSKTYFTIYGVGDKLNFDEQTKVFSTNAYSSSNHLVGFKTSNIKPGHTYTISLEIVTSPTNGSIWIGFGNGSYDSYRYNDTLFYTSMNVSNGQKVSFTLKIPEDGNYADDWIVGAINHNTGTGLQYKNIQLEEGDTATEWEPHLKKDIVIPKFTRGDISLKAIWEPNTYTVTFDANGGSVSTASKEVKYHENYDTLPIPTREGYTFLGWNGKNMFDKEDVTLGYYLSSDGTSILYNDWAFSNYIEVQGGKTYTFNPNSSSGNAAYHVIYDSQKNRIDSVSSGPQSILMPLNAKYFRASYRINTNGPDTQSSANIQLEEGDTPTEYEPYYITSDTKVVQTKDHILKAIWKQN